MLPNDKTSDRIGHFRPNDALYFHKNNKGRSEFTPGWNEPVYQYRETKLETVPKTRASPTFSSSILGSRCYQYNVPKTANTGAHSVVHAETTKQRFYHKEGYSDYVPRREVPMSPTKPYRQEPY